MLNFRPSSNVRKWPSGVWPSVITPMGNALRGSRYAPGSWMTNGLALVVNCATWPVPLMNSLSLNNRFFTAYNVVDIDSNTGLKIIAGAAYVNAPSQVFRFNNGERWTMIVAGSTGTLANPATDGSGAISSSFVNPASNHRVGMTVYGPGHNTTTLRNKGRMYYGASATIFGEITTAMADTTSYSVYASVFNGTGATNADKAKFYRNGVLQPMTYTGVIPANMSALDSNEISLCRTFSPTAAYNGGYYWMAMFYNRS